MNMEKLAEDVAYSVLSKLADWNQMKQNFNLAKDYWTGGDWKATAFGERPQLGPAMQPPKAPAPPQPQPAVASAPPAPPSTPGGFMNNALGGVNKALRGQ